MDFLLPLAKHDIRHPRRVAERFQETKILIKAQLPLKPPSPFAEGEPEGGVKSTCFKEARPWGKIKSHS